MNVLSVGSARVSDGDVIDEQMSTAEFALFKSFPKTVIVSEGILYFVYSAIRKQLSR